VNFLEIRKHAAFEVETWDALVETTNEHEYTRMGQCVLTKQLLYLLVCIRVNSWFLKLRRIGLCDFPYKK